MAMYFLTFHAKPELDKDKSEGIGGAFINCWVEASTLDQAIEIAEQKIAETNWSIIKKEEAYEITRGDYAVNTDGLKYYDQALIDKWVLVYHTYPLDDREK